MDLDLDLDLDLGGSPRILVLPALGQQVRASAAAQAAPGTAGVEWGGFRYRLDMDPVPDPRTQEKIAGVKQS